MICDGILKRIFFLSKCVIKIRVLKGNTIIDGNYMMDFNRYLAKFQRKKKTEYT